VSRIETVWLKIFTRKRLVGSALKYKIGIPALPETVLFWVKTSVISGERSHCGTVKAGA
jgi:hypothetical protein